jgi:hypothetical protein
MVWKLAKESRVAGDQQLGSEQGSNRPASTADMPTTDFVLAEPIDWVARRLLQRSNEAARESDLNRRGIETVLAWLADDEHVFAQKYRTFLSNVENADDPVEFNVIAEQLHRLRYRSFELLVSGLDPADSHPPSPEGSGRSTAYRFPIPRLAVSKSKLTAYDEQFESLTKDEMRRRFLAVGCVIEDVATWIQRREFDATNQDPVNQ